MNNQDIRHFLQHNNALVPSMIILDVRGTVLDGYQDLPAESLLLLTIQSCLRHRIPIALLTGCSRETVETLILQPMLQLLKFSANESFDGIYVYTSTGCEGYVVTDGRLQLLEDYPSLRLTSHDRHTVQTILESVTATTQINASIEHREGQINCYVKANRRQRIEIGQSVRSRLKHSGLRDFHVTVPSAKDVVDVSLGSKLQAARHFQSVAESPTLAHRPVWVISDSLEQDGADVGLLDQLDFVVGVHVGDSSKMLHPKAVAFQGGPQATQTVLSYALTLFLNLKKL